MGKTLPWAAKILRFLDLKIVICKGKMPPEAENILRFVDIKIGICKGAFIYYVINWEGVGVRRL